MAPAVGQADVVAALRTSSVYGSTEPVEHRETHISHVFLVAGRAYKLKKELVLPFVDYGTLDRRHFFCREEIRLNRPLAPTVYVEVRAVVLTPDGFALGAEDDPGAVEYLVEMRRFDESCTLGAIVREGRVDELVLRNVGAAIARFHARAEQVARARGGELQRRRVEADLAQLERACSEHDAKAVAGHARAFVARAAAQLDERAERGLVRDGHGDLRLEHILVRDAIEFVDCVEFDIELRAADVAYDLAFAVMELHHEKLPERAQELTAAYRAAGGDPGDEFLVAGLAACRALVRAKVAALRSPLRPGELGQFLETAKRLFWLARGPVTVFVCGPAGSGKTTLASELARTSGLPHLSSDVVRKAMAGVAPTATIDKSGYSAAASRRTYAELGRRARAHAVDRGSIVDATFRFARDRTAFDATFEGAPGPRIVLRLDVPPDLAARRAACRAAGPRQPSDAGGEQALTQAVEFEPLAGWWLACSAMLDSGLEPRAVAELAEAAIDRALGS